MTKSLQDFDMHEVNRLIMRENIPGFKMLPKEQVYLAEYRQALREHYNYEDTNNEQNNGPVKIEMEVEKPKRSNRRKSTRHDRDITSESMGDNGRVEPNPVEENAPIAPVDETEPVVPTDDIEPVVPPIESFVEITEEPKSE